MYGSAGRNNPPIVIFYEQITLHLYVPPIPPFFLIPTIPF